ncbi:TRAP transporter large permease subunit [Mariniphaga sediminis]|jgi:di/tricarboxylate transporter|uniref:TRAP transporter large permease subunit n=1 Tax=Mariniphaga sediminis TaxID=1628158 RepID=A0A399D2H9_9BACT|nr:SLC13 family permease [Mariniphaga sediminis]RIH64892.1 TRAP transporter large permease subunit [Mariniphaga sediminis]
MTLEGYIVVAVIILTIVALAKEVMRPGLVFFSAAVVLMSTGIISDKELLAGFSNKGMITVGVLFLVSEGVRQSGVLNRLAQTYLPRKRGRMVFLIPRIMLPVSVLSAFLNNTPVVVIFAPIIKKWSETLNLSHKKFLIPLSFATILGGMCTLIGTSTNLVVHGLILENGYPGFGMFELGKVGLLIAIIGTIYIAIAGNKLLPGKKILFNTRSSAGSKDYYYDVLIPENSTLIGLEATNGRLRELSKLSIRCIEREGNIIETKRGTFKILPNDKLMLAGKSDRLNYILANDNIRLSGLDHIKNVPKDKLKQYEAVISPRFPGIGETIPEFNFYEHYQAVVLAIHRNGERITSNMNNLKLKPGDNLVLLTTDNFIQNWGDSRIFYMTSYIRDYRATGTFWTKWLAFIILLAMIIGATVGRYFESPAGLTFDMFFFSVLAAVLLVWLKIMPHQKYTRAISWDVLITIACAFAISKAMQNSGAAESLARTTINFSKAFGPVGILAALYIVTAIATEIVTNNAAAALTFPIALSAAQQLNLDPKPFFVAIAIAASASFSTPIGYQTNLIVQAIGNYKFTDYVKIGLPLNIIAFILSLLLIPVFWEF